MNADNLDQDIAHKHKLLETYKRRKRERELQAAQLGVGVDPAIKLEIEDIQNEIDVLERSIAESVNMGEISRGNAVELRRGSKVVDSISVEEHFSKEKEILEGKRVTWGRGRKGFAIKIATSLLLVFIIGITIGYYVLISQYSGFASDLTPLWMGIAQVNAKNDTYVAGIPGINTPLTWYKWKPDGLESSSEVQVNYSSINHYLYYSSKLNKKEYGWTGIFFWRKFPLPTLDVSRNSELVAIIYAEEPDVLEIGFTDVHGNEKKIALRVVKAWAGYRIPLNEFSSVDFNKIQLFLIAHTRGLTSNDENSFKIALLGFR